MAVAVAVFFGGGFRVFVLLSAAVFVVMFMAVPAGAAIMGMLMGMRMGGGRFFAAAAERINRGPGLDF